jgi:hypothetical protein
LDAAAGRVEHGYYQEHPEARRPDARVYEITDYLCFGLVEGWETELGYFSLLELLTEVGMHGLRIERDEDFELIRLEDLKERLWQNRLRVA